MVINDLVAFVVKFWVLGKAKKVVSQVQGMKSFFSHICSRRVSEDFARCVLRQEDFRRNLLIFLLLRKNQKISEKTSRKVFSDKHVSFAIDRCLSEI